MNTNDIVSQVLKEALPDSLPPSFDRVITATYLRKGKRPIINADLEMFDGQKASVQLVKWDHSWSHQWTSLEGGPIAWDGVKWIRKGE